MQKLYSYALCPFCRAIRFYLNERAIDFELINSSPWEKDNKFNNNDLSIDIPILIDGDRDKLPVSGFSSIIQYFDESNHMNRLTGITSSERLEVQRICEKFNFYFFADVSRPLIYEKVLKRYYNSRSPNSIIIRESMDKMKEYMDAIGWLFERRNWLAGEDFSLADIVVAAHISCIDYVGSIDWSRFIRVKEWYMRIKSRPSFRDILQDRIQGVHPAEHYPLLDY